MENENLPKTLLEAVRFFTDLDICTQFMAAIRWPEGVTCPRCDHNETSFVKTRRLWQCKGCRKQFTIKTGSVMEDSPIGLDKWLPAIWMIVNAKNGVSSYEISRHLGVTQKTAWFMLHRIRLAMQSRTWNKMSGDIEVDETYIGGNARFMHKDRREARIKGTGGNTKIAVMGLLERHGGEVRTRVILEPNAKTLQGEVRRHVESGSQVFTDGAGGYMGLDDEYVHQVINHAEEYVNGNVHTQGIENFWSLLKRTIKGTYVSVEPFHLFRYLDEQAFRFNKRLGNDLYRFIETAKALTGRRLTFEELTGETTNH
ncbi:MAG TPA: IS1595 family transposase [Pyrinomonadaceae bacterium]|nr:IS1595 family transposase [Pyrinomonadaceae bacterium]